VGVLKVDVHSLGDINGRKTYISSPISPLKENSPQGIIRRVIGAMTLKLF
jgi:hypothetical protein